MADERVVSVKLEQIEQYYDELVGAQLGQVVETVREQRVVRDLHYSLGLVLGEGVEPRLFLGREYDGFHVNNGESTPS